MGKLNLITGSWNGKVGEFVGAKWKDKKTLRAYAIPANPNTAMQQQTRTGFGAVSKFVALFSDQIKSLSALNTRGMTVRNAILSLNKMQIRDGALNEANLQISNGGLPVPGGGTLPTAPANNDYAVPVTQITGTNISDKCKLVAVVVCPAKSIAAVASTANQTGTITVPITLVAGDVVHCYTYAIDYRGSSKVGSKSMHRTATIA